MRTIWKGAVSFGLVSIPVNLFPATEKKKIKFTHLHDKCKAPLKYKRVCTSCGREVAWENTLRGYEYEKGKYVILKEEELDPFPQGRSKTVDILNFVDLKEIDPVYFDKTYYLSPGETAEKAYLLLKKTMEETGKIAIARVMIRTRETLAALRVYNNLLTMETMFFPDEVRSTEMVATPVQEEGINLQESELKMARQLVENLVTAFEPAKYKDQYRERILETIQAKAAGKEIETPQAPREDKIVNLVEALQASVEMTEKGGKESKKKGKKPGKKAGAV
ncbi:MAG: Ku protein [Candidatus Syntrophonatronum acetioxidans]|uniref:Non-homologous end joining protein Ku n=1 Tax=Candidatus Syntrophonatronum acetioxidans TaxID=1795816 RepID=A0A424YD35_9FIRM|nr:MAG: Ku protein [Candidatus Syntrophonatronum acetioxidans]